MSRPVSHVVRLLPLASLLALAAACTPRAPAPPPLPPGYPPFAEASARCDAGDAVSCAWVASMHRFGIGVPFSADHGSRAIGYAERACDLGLVEGCTNVAIAYVESRRELPKAEALVTESCRRGHALGCVHLALLQPDRLVPDALAEAAFPLLDAECAAPRSGQPPAPAYVWRTSSESSCEIVGRMLAAGRGTARDMVRARAAFARGCNVSTAACDLARGADGEPCPHGCRGTEDHSSTCIDGICEADLPLGAKCKAAKKACTRGSYCDHASPEPACAAKKPHGAPCASTFECVDEHCERGRCKEPPVHTTN
jgi:TPR repeat protein